MLASGFNPGVHVTWRTIRAPEPVRIDVAGFVGIAARGPLDRTVAVEGWAEFVATFGDFQPNAFLAYAVRGFFDNGGRRCHVARVAAPALETMTTGAQRANGAASRLLATDGVRAGALATLEQRASTAAVGAQPADRRASVVASLGGFAAGARVLLHQAARRPIALECARVEAGASTLHWTAPIDAAIDLTQPFTLSTVTRDLRLVAAVAGDLVDWTRPLDARFDLTAPIAIGFGAGTARATLWDERGAALLAVAAATPGRWGDSLGVRVTTSLAAEIATVPRIAPDPADRLSLRRIAGLAPGAIIEIVQDGVAAVRNRIVAVDAAAAAVTIAHALAGFDLAGAAAGTKPIRLRRLSFALSVREGGRLVEQFADLDLPGIGDPQASPVNGASTRIRITRVGADDDAWLDPGSAALDFGEARLWGGRDGVAMLRTRDFTGREDAAERCGLRLFELADEPAALAAPDLWLPPTLPIETLPPEPLQPDPCALCPPPAIPPAPLPAAAIVEASPSLTADDARAVQQALVEHCEARGDRLALLDPPGGGFDFPDLLDWRRHFDSSYAATYFPWVAVVDPIAALPERLRLVPAVGHALGGYAAADADAGHDAPANRALAWVAGVARPIDDEQHGFLNERGVNAVLTRPGRGIRVMGARTLASEADWRQLTVRRVLLRLKRSLARELAWAVFEPAGLALERDLVATVEGLLEREWQARRLAGATADQAFAVRVLRSADDADNGRFVVLVDVAPAVPAEFIQLQIVRSLDRVDIAEAGAVRGWP